MTLWQLFREMIDKYRWRSLFVLVLSTAVVLSSTALLSLSAYIIAFCGLTPAIEAIMVPVVGVRFFGLLRGILRYSERLVSHGTTFSMLGDFRTTLYRSVSRRPMAEILSMDKTDVFIRIVDDVERLQEFYLRTFNPFGTALLTGAAGYFWIRIWGGGEAAVFLAGYGACVLLLPMYLHRHARGFEAAALEKAVRLKQRQMEGIAGLAEITTTGSRGKWQADLMREAEALSSVMEKLAWTKSLSSQGIQLMMYSATLLCVYLSARRVMEGTMEPVILPVIAYAVMALFEGAQPMPQILMKLEMSRSCAQRIGVLMGETGWNEAERGVDPAEPELSRIHFKAVSFQYPQGSPQLLQDISFTLEQGKRIAVIGQSGCGKSTLGYLLLGWLRPTKGVVDYEASRPAAGGICVEQHCHLIQQTPYFFNTTIRSNLKLANQQATDEQICAALTRAGLDEWATQDGLDRELGEGEMRISGGEKQRLALARSFLTRARFLILDEVTAGLDVVTEAKIMNRFFQENREKGLLVLTHRLVEMQRFDEILLLSEGRIRERGSHEALIAQGGWYAAMVALQEQTFE